MPSDIWSTEDLIKYAIVALAFSARNKEAFLEYQKLSETGRMEVEASWTDGQRSHLALSANVQLILEHED